MYSAVLTKVRRGRHVSFFVTLTRLFIPIIVAVTRSDVIGAYVIVFGAADEGSGALFVVMCGWCRMATEKLILSYCPNGG